MKKQNAQAHVIEMISAVILFIGVLLFVSSFSAPHQEPDYSFTQLKTLGDDSLRTLDNTPTSDGLYHNSTLVKYIANDTTNLTKFLNLSLPETVSYSIYLRTISERVSIHYMGTPIGDTAVAHRIIVYNGNVYDVELVMWYEPRLS
jgi:hypothetical protein